MSAQGFYEALDTYLSATWWRKFFPLSFPAFSAFSASPAFSALLCTARCISQDLHLLCTPSHYGSQYYFRRKTWENRFQQRRNRSLFSAFDHARGNPGGAETDQGCKHPLYRRRGAGVTDRTLSGGCRRWTARPGRLRCCRFFQSTTANPAWNR